ncbi:GPI-linked NAD(P)(+)--arginine ADP-ribosyltransferase 1, partial [Cuculus canorus]|uniref:GPI-linked NAD(P)(+)--arginine ADP-ribosyltransferase 1 n=1 Tax=Cuculus canorus TaxID=55661 RepID=UPI0023AAE670
TTTTSSPLDAVPMAEVPLDLATTSFDDRYVGCAGAMDEELEDLNRTEFSTNGVYAQAWTLAAAEWRSRHGRVPPVLRPEHAVALLAYTKHGPLFRAFNAAVREDGRSHRHYLDNFRFKAFHFLLSEALRVLRGTRSSRCHRVYRGVHGIRFTAQRHQRVRFGQFTSASLREESALAFGHDTVFSVETCYGVPIKDFSFYPEEDEVLIPPFEVFEVTDVTSGGGGALIELRSRDADSAYNCEWVKERRCRDRPCDLGAGWSVRGDPSLLWGLLMVTTTLVATEGP